MLQKLELHETRFGFEPEVVAQIARLRLRIYETGSSYAGRTYDEGKKIGFKDGVRALYCIFRYSMPHAPLSVLFGGYLIGAAGNLCGVANLLLFIALTAIVSAATAAPIAFALAAFFNYWLCVTFLFRHSAKWATTGEVAVYLLVVVVAGGIDWARRLSSSEPAWRRFPAEPR